GEIYYQNEGRKNIDRILTLGYRFEKPTEKSRSVTGIRKLDDNSYEQNLFRNDIGHTEHQANINYSFPVNDLTVDAGIKAIFRDKFSRGEVQNIDPAYISALSYQQNIMAAYNSYYYRHDRFGARMMLSYERTAMKTDISNSKTKVLHALLPLLDLQFQTNKGRFNLMYEQSISRPAIQDLNNFPDFSNPN